VSKFETEVLIIGGGVNGASIARELSKYKVDVILVEKKVDVGQSITKHSFSNVKQGSFAQAFRPGDLRTKLLWDSLPLMGPLCEELDVPTKNQGELRVYSNAAELASAQENKRLADENATKYGGPDFGLQWIDTETLRSWEPNISKKFVGALYDPNLTATDPVRYTMALVSNAKKNGVNVVLETEVEAISRREEGRGLQVFDVETTRGSIKCQFIVNAAGEYVHEVARMAGADDFASFPLIIYTGVLDKKLGGLVNHQIMHHATSYVNPNIHDNLFIGEPLTPWKKYHDHATSKTLADLGLKQAQDILPDISPTDRINYHAGIAMFRDLETGWEEYVCAISRWVPKFINIQTSVPGVSASPGTAKYTVKLLAREGLKLEENPNFDPYEKAIPDFSELSDEEKKQLIAQDPRYGHVVCRCETVTEGEIVEAIKRGARTLDGVKFRCRPGMGRCHGGFCSPRVMAILSRELNIPEEQITKKGPVSRHLLFKSKELLRSSQS